MVRTAALDQLQLLNELNREFLGLLQERVRHHRAPLGLPSGVALALAAATGAVLDSVASFPRALFLVPLEPRGRRHERAADFDEAEHDLCLSILLAARSSSRHSVYQARLLFGLEGEQIERLCRSPLSELQRLACEAGNLQCSFRERPWFWPGLFAATRPELRRQLTLMALQPGAAVAWPPRRPPHASA